MGFFRLQKIQNLVKTVENVLNLLAIDLDDDDIEELGTIVCSYVKSILIRFVLALIYKMSSSKRERILSYSKSAG